MPRPLRSLILLLLFFPALHSQSSSILIELQPRRNVYSLPHRFVTVDSLVLPGFRPPAADSRHNPSTFPGTDSLDLPMNPMTDSLRWTLDKGRGRLILLEAVEYPMPVILYYRFASQDLPLQLDLGLEKTDSLHSEERDRYVPASGENDPRNASITATGTILRGFQLSSGGQGDVQNDMNLRILGELSPGVTVQGHISDNSAVTEDGATGSQLRELDNIRLMVNAPGAGLQIGDILVESRSSSLNTYSKKIMGLQGSVQRQQLQAQAFFGSARGRYRRQDLQLREGSQGPYTLQAEHSSASVFIVPGSETVYLNGQVLERSEYLVRYRDAEILFTGSRLLSPEDRVSVEFSYQDRLYPRSSTGMEASATAGPLQFKAGFFREADNGDAPADPVLALIGPDSLKQLPLDENFMLNISTAVEDSLGNYVLQDSIWVYTGPGSGTHSVYFYREEISGGYARRYDSEGLVYFAYAPDELGSSYFPRRPAAAPDALTVAHSALSLGTDPRRRLELEYAGSSYQPNSFARPEPQTAALTEMRLHYALFPQNDGLNLELSSWNRGQSFRSFRSLQAPDLHRSLGLYSSEDIVGAHKAALRSESTLHLVRSSFSLYESLSEGQRGLYEQSLQLKKPFDLSLRHSQLTDRGLLPYFNSEAQLNVTLPWMIRSRTSLNKEFHGRVYSGILPLRREGFSQSLHWRESLSAGYRLIEDRDLSADGRWQRYSRKQDASLGISLTAFHNLDLNSDLSLRFDQRDTGTDRYFLGRSRAELQLPALHSRLQLSSSLNRSSENLREPVFYYIGEGLGTHRWDPGAGEYLPDDLGTHILRYENSAEKLDEVHHISELDYEYRRGGQKPASPSFNYRLRGRVEYRAPRSILFSPLADSLITEIHSARNTLRQELRLQSADRRNLFRISWDQDRQQANRDIAYRQLSSSDKFTAELTRRQGRRSLRLNYHYRDAARQRIPLGSYSIRNFRHILGLEGSLPTPWPGDLNLQLSRSDILTLFTEDFRSRIYEFRIRQRYDPAPGDQLFLELRFADLQSDYQASLPYEVADGYSSGSNASYILRYSRQLNRTLSVNIQLQKRQRQGSRDVNIARMEVRAFF